MTCPKHFQIITYKKVVEQVSIVRDPNGFFEF